MSEDKRTATQKIDDLEKVVTILYQAATQTQNTIQGLTKLGSDMALVRDALKLLNKKTEAIIQVATPETGITVESVTALVVKMNVEDLKAQVAGYLANGHLTTADTVAGNSYVVCEESNSDGSVANPRIQFRLDSQDEATTAALTGKKAGDTVSFGEGKFGAKILEIYTINDNPTPAATATPDAAPAATAEAPAAEAAPATETPTADVQGAPTGNDTPAPAAAAPTGPSNEALATPTESPVTEFVPSQPGTMTVAS
ncbi:MAG TPA: hypothetical protein VIJ14_10620 [Rhabdochlamydiaceae bacterium]